MFVTGIGLSNTLGAFLAGLLLAETKYRSESRGSQSNFVKWGWSDFILTTILSERLLIYAHSFFSLFLTPFLLHAHTHTHTHTNDGKDIK